MGRILPYLAIALLVSACGGKLDISDFDPPPSSTSDTGGQDATVDPTNISPGPDSGTDPDRDLGVLPREDTGVVDPVDMGGSPDMTMVVCEESMCGGGASCVDNACQCDDGLFGDPYAGCSPANPCDGVTCPDGASCNPDGSCSCDPFFADDGNGGCNPTAPAADLAARTVDDVCQIWTNDYARTSNDTYLFAPTEECDPGMLHPEEMREALHRTSVYRMLVGLYPVSLADGHRERTQECAMMMNANNDLDHDPPTSWQCYTDIGAAGAGSSNIALGVGTAAGTVRLYIQDPGTPSLGHRRWIFNPSMAKTSFGHKSRGGCMYSFDRGRNHSVDFVAYPSPGPFPDAALTGKWSIHGGASYQGDDVVTITNMSDGSDVAVSNITAPVFGNLASTLSWTVGSPPTGVDLQITIDDADGTQKQQYTTRLVDCP